MINKKEEQKVIYYKDVMDLGFKVDEQVDEVYEDQHGYPYKIITLKLSKGVYIDWDQPTRFCEMYRTNKDGWILARWPIANLKELQRIVTFFKWKKLK